MVGSYPVVVEERAYQVVEVVVVDWVVVQDKMLLAVVLIKKVVISKNEILSRFLRG